jgi:amino-acid N-acetyltransferase
MHAETDYQRYVEWFRNSAPYINAHRGRTFVIQFGSESLSASFIDDIALLSSLGIRLVLVHGARPQVEKRLTGHGLDTHYAEGLRITDEETLVLFKEAIGCIRLEIEALLSKGLANSPMAGARLRVASGNFVTARPIGIRNGIDFRYTGEVRRIDHASIRQRLEEGAIVLISPLGFSPTGEIFNLRAEEVAIATAIALQAEKLLLLTDSPGLLDTEGKLIRQCSLGEVKEFLREQARSNKDTKDALITRYLSWAAHACSNGVKRTHLLDRRTNGALLIELFTRDGVGTMVSSTPYERTRRANIDDVAGILELIQPMEEDGTLVRRSREKLETEIERFTVMDRDGAIIGCVAVYPFAEEGVAELACLAVHKDYQNNTRGVALLEAAESEARHFEATILFVLTTRTTHWFMEHGFTNATLDALPVARQAMYNYQRNSRVLVKHLVPESHSRSSAMPAVARRRR